MPAISVAPRRPTRLLAAAVASLAAGAIATPTAGAASSWFVSNSPTGAPPVTALGFGDLGNVFFAGDWNGDGIDSVSIFRSSPGGPNTFSLATSNIAGGGAPTPFTLGDPGDRPIAGDWNGDGTDTIGLFRETGGPPHFLEAQSNQTATAVNEFSYGNPGDLPLTGDWNGDRIDTIGIFRRTGEGAGWALAGSNISGGGTLRAFQFGNLDDSPVVGDWDANGTSTAGVVRPALEYVPPPPGPVAPSPNGQNASRAAQLSVRFSSTRSRAPRLGFGARPVIAGALVNESGAPIAGATLVVSARRRQSGAVTAPVDTVSTAADGSFSLPCRAVRRAR